MFLCIKIMVVASTQLISVIYLVTTYWGGRFYTAGRDRWSLLHSWKGKGGRFYTAGRAKVVASTQLEGQRWSLLHSWKGKGGRKPSESGRFYTADHYFSYLFVSNENTYSLLLLKTKLYPYNLVVIYI